MAMQQLSEKGRRLLRATQTIQAMYSVPLPLGLCEHEKERQKNQKPKTMQSSPCQTDTPAGPRPAPCNPGLPGNLVHAPLTVAWRSRPSATDLCVPRRLRSHFLSSIWLSPAFLAPSTVAKLSPKYLSCPLLTRVTTVALLPWQPPWANRLLSSRGAARWHQVAARLSFLSPATRCQELSSLAPCRLTYSGEQWA